MRVTPAMIGSRMGADLSAALAALAREQTLIASGRRVLAPADDPAAFAQAEVVRARQAANDQFQANLGGARDALGAGEAAVRSVLDALARARELAVQGANDTNDALARQSLAGEVDTLLEGVVSLGNARSATGAMLFGGTETTVAPYTAVRDLSGRITGVTVNARGIDGTNATEVSEGTTLEMAISGTTVFGAPTDATYVFDVLVRLRDALAANDGVATGATLNDLSATIDRGTLAQTVLGSRLGWLETLDSRLKDDAVTQAGSLSRLQDLDVTKASTELAQLQMTYEAGLASGARILQRSLLDFLR